MISRIRIAAFILLLMLPCAAHAEDNLTFSMAGPYWTTNYSVPKNYICDQSMRILVEREISSKKDLSLLPIVVNFTDLTPACVHEEYASARRKSWHEFKEYGSVTIKTGSAEILKSWIEAKQDSNRNIYTHTDQDGFRHFREIILADRPNDYDEFLLPPQNFFSKPSHLICETPSMNNPDGEQICTLTQLYKDDIFFVYHFNKKYLDQIHKTEIATEAFLAKYITSQERINSRKIIGFNEPDCPGNVLLVIGKVHLQVPRKTEQIYVEGNSINGDLHPRYNCNLKEIINTSGVSIGQPKAGGLSISNEAMETTYQEYKALAQQQLKTSSQGVKYNLDQYYNHFMLPLSKFPTYNKEPILIACNNQGKTRNCKTVFIHTSGLYVASYFESHENDPDSFLAIEAKLIKSINDMIVN